MFVISLFIQRIKTSSGEAFSQKWPFPQLSLQQSLFFSFLNEAAYVCSFCRGGDYPFFCPAVAVESTSSFPLTEYRWRRAGALGYIYSGHSPAMLPLNLQMSLVRSEQGIAQVFIRQKQT